MSAAVQTLRVRCETLNTILIGGFEMSNWPSSVETATIVAAHHPPNKRAAAMWMMKDVVPVAARRNCVFKFSRKLATKTKVATGHQPGKGSLYEATADTDSAAVAAMAQTYSRILKSFDICRGKGFPVDFTS